MDPPSNAEAFVHRCGRTARIGNKGASILLLCPNEETYVDFLSINQKVTLNRLDHSEPIRNGDGSTLSRAARARCLP